MSAQTFDLWNKHPNRDLVRANCDAFVTRMLDAGHDVHIEVGRITKTRTPKQRRALFGPAYKAIMEFCGYRGGAEKDELHRNMCGEYFGWRDDPALGRVPVRTTTRDERGQKNEISVADALDMYAFIQQFAIEKLACHVPDPDPMWREKAREAA